mmetsp:Transcript_18455/g.53220  ORF Transcript_18455/g.53220 Transcript_18455/m.53220 type:complete len:80 (+) Transcript_18455:665-904(+)
MERLIFPQHAVTCAAATCEKWNCLLILSQYLLPWYMGQLSDLLESRCLGLVKWMLQHVPGLELLERMPEEPSFSSFAND